MRAGFCSLILLLLSLTAAQARINVVTLPGRDSTQLTIYNSVDLTLVKESRTLTFRKGLNKLEFSWANTLIDPTSVEFKALTHADAVDVLDVSFPPRVSNTLEWRIQSEFAGEVTVEIRYFTSGITWSADYVAEATKDERFAALAGHVRVTNKSGEDYDNAQFRLVVGTVRLVETIAALSAPRSGGMVTNAVRLNYWAMEDEKRKDVRRELESAVTFADRGGMGGFGGGGRRQAEVIKEALSEYFLYTVEGRDTIASGSSKRLPSFATNGIPITSLYKFEKERWGAAVMRYYRFTNSEPSKLGKEPLPDGDVKAFRLITDDKLYAFVGRTAVKYIPVNESVEMELGPDREVLVKPTLMNYVKTDLAFDNDGNVKGWTTKETWEFEVQNSKDIDVVLDIRRNFSGDWSLATGATYEKLDATKVKLLLPLKSRERQRFAYELTVKHGTNATR